LLKGKCTLVTGIDVDPKAEDNPYIDRFLLINGQGWPLPDISVDVAIADYVLEHVTNPDTFFAECQRVVKDNGMLCIRTTNRNGYVATIASLTPHHWHSTMLNIGQPGRKHEDTFRTEYQINTVNRLTNLLSRYGFNEHCVYTHESEPAYFEFSKVLFRIAAQWHQVSPAWLRNTIFAFAKKAQE
jgi:ubiquinone/menaquinone biosynthesis C-methylase UbiE